MLFHTKAFLESPLVLLALVLHSLSSKGGRSSLAESKRACEDFQRDRAEIPGGM